MMASNNVLINSLSHDGMVCLTAEDHKYLGAVVRNYFATSDGSDDDEMDCGK